MRLLLLILLTSSADIIFAQQTLKVKSYGVDQGLPQSTVWDILQDDFGFLWISTADGLCRFDGYTFNTYRNNSLDSTAIGGNTMHLMTKDLKGNIWLTHENGLDIYDSEQGNFQHLLKFGKTNVNGLNKTLGTDQNGNIWVWIREQGLLQYDSKSKILIHKYSPEQSILTRSAQDGFIDKNTGEVIICMSSEYIVRFNPTNRKFNTVSLPAGWNVNSALQMNDSIYLLGTSKGIARLNSKSGIIEQIPFTTIPFAKTYDLFATTSLLHYQDDEFWIGTSNGIFIYNDKTKSFYTFYNSFAGSKENFLFVQKLFKDKSGNVWIGTNGDGLKKFSPNVQPWKHYQSNSDRSDIVKSIYSDGEDLVFVGYYQNGIDIFSKSKGWLNKIRKSIILPSDNVYNIMAINDSELLLGFSDIQSKSYGILNFKDKSFKNISQNIVKELPTNIQGGNPFVSTLKLNNETILFNYQSHLFELNYSYYPEHKIQRIHTFDNENINTIFIDSNKILWVGTMDGYFYKVPDGTWQKGIKEINKQVKTINEDSDGNIWLGTVSGIYVLSKTRELTQVYRMGSELANDFVYGILRDNYGDMWFSHNKGLSKFNHESKSFIHYSVDDGLQANEFNTGAFFKSSSGELFFGGINGTNSFFPDEITDNDEKPTVQITRIEVNDKPWLTGKVPWAENEIIVNYASNTLAFEVAGLEYTEPGKNKYAWRMTNFDRNWVQAGNRRFTRYANMPPGEYTFEVKASNNDGLWNEVPTRIHIIITPPYWQTWWFRSLEVIVLATTIGVIAFLISRQRYKRKISELLTQQKIQRDRDRISRDLHDNVGAMVSYVGTKIDWLLRHNQFNEETQEQLKTVKESASTTMTGLRETIWTLQDKAITNTDLADKIKTYAKSRLLIPCNITDDINGEVPLNNEAVLNIYRACQEVVTNINKHSEATLVQIRFSSTQHCFEVEIEDNGKGFNQQQSESADHFGLKNIKSRLKDVNATVEISSIVNVGTKFKIAYNG